MKTNLNNIWHKCTWQNLQQDYMQQMWDLFVERRYFKFHKSSASAEVADRNVTWYVL